MPKVIAKDNFNRDGVSDRLIEDRLTENRAISLAAKLNQEAGPNAIWFYVAVADDVQLYRWEP